MSSLFRLLLVIIIVAVAAGGVYWIEPVQAQRTAGYEAGNKPTWAQTKRRVKNLRGKSSAEYCERAWDMVWPWAKAGNLGARHYLHLLIIQNVFRNVQIIPPGVEKTGEAWFDNVVIWGIYAHDYSSDKKKSYENFTKFIVKGFYEKADLQEGKGKRFYDCVKADNEICTHLAEEDGVVEPFEEYAKRIDRLLESGIKAKCKGFSDENST